MLKYIDNYIICDTGSTDNTKQIIKDFFEKHNIPGIIYDDQWEDFGHNRTLALERCKGETEYAWVIDADDIIVGDLVLPEKLDADCYLLQYGTGFVYHRQQIFRISDDLNWRYRGVLHEYPECDKFNFTKPIIGGKYYIDSRRLGDRSKDPNKYLRDAHILEKGLEKEPNNERYVFYIAQSYFDHGDIETGIKWYTRRIALGGWFEEVYYSYYRIASGLEILKKPWEEVELAYLAAYNYCKDRAESLYHIALHYRGVEDFKKAYKYAKIGSLIKYPQHCSLFVMKDVYDYKMLDELSINAFFIGEYMESLLICKKLLANPDLPPDYRERVKKNLEFNSTKLSAVDKSNCIIYTGYTNINNDQDLADLIKDYQICYNIYLVGHNINISDVKSFNYNNVYYLTIKQLEKMKSNNKFDYVIMYDNLDMLFDQTPLKSCKLILYLTNRYFRYSIKGRITVKLTNEDIINRLIREISIIIVKSSNLVDNLKTDYQLTENIYSVENSADLYKVIGNNNYRYKCKIDSSSNHCNGYELVIPEYSYTDSNKMYVENTILDLLLEIRALVPRPEIEYYCAKYYQKLDMNPHALTCIEKAIKMCEIQTDNWFNYVDYLNLVKADIQYELGNHLESYNLSNNILKRDKLKEDDRIFGNLVRDKNIDHLKDKSLVYPTERIKKITTRLNNPVKTFDVVFSITTCKRYKLFEKTINSFINNCMDLDKINHWICVDDNSSQEDRQKMQEKYPFFTYIFKDQTEKGHYKSMNIICDFVNKHKSKYLLHMEDDFHFVTPRNYVLDSIKILSVDKSYGQVLFNKNYAEEESSKPHGYIPGGVLKKINKTRYYIHEHIDPEKEAEKYHEFINKHKKYGTNAYWPHFSFRPSMMKVSMLVDLGEFCNTSHFERQYAFDYRDKHYLSCFFDDFCCIHIGKKTWEHDGLNSYHLNKTNQFTIINQLKEKININIIRSGVFNIWKSFKSSANKNLPFYEIANIKNNTDIPVRFRKLFIDNNFNYNREIVNEYLMHLENIDNNSSKYCMIIYDTVKFMDNFNLNEILNYLDEHPDTDICNLSDDHLGLAYVIRQTSFNKLIDNFTSSLTEDISSMFNLDLKIDPLVQIKGMILKKETLKYKQLDGYKFYSQLDSYGNDIEHDNSSTLDELKKKCDLNLGALGFNTSGWIKNVIHPDENLIWLYKSNSGSQGLYVKL
jgi:hypothetical protein